MVLDHLSRLENVGEQLEDVIQEKFPYELIFEIKAQISWYMDCINYIACGVLPPNLSSPMEEVPS